MRVPTMLAGLTVALAISTAWAGQTDGVRAIEVRGLDLGDVGQSSAQWPVVITSPDELYNAIGDEEVAAVINGQIDFSRETLLYFKWAGAGQDRIKVTTATTSDGLEATFVFRPGLTLELTPHHRLFAVANDVTWKVAAAVPAGER